MVNFNEQLNIQTDRDNATYLICTILFILSRRLQIRILNRYDMEEEYRLEFLVINYLFWFVIKSVGVRIERALRV
jgi:hypothetical protein